MRKIEVTEAMIDAGFAATIWPNLDKAPAALTAAMRSSMTKEYQAMRALEPAAPVGELIKRLNELAVFARSVDMRLFADAAEEAVATLAFRDEVIEQAASKCCGNYDTLVDAPECQDCPSRKHYLRTSAPGACPACGNTKRHLSGCVEAGKYPPAAPAAPAQGEPPDGVYQFELDRGEGDHEEEFVTKDDYDTLRAELAAQVVRNKELEGRLNWLHSPESSNIGGYEWGIYRVKWENGQPKEVWQTLSDFSDLDTAIKQSALKEQS